MFEGRVNAREIVRAEGAQKWWWRMKRVHRLFVMRWFFSSGGNWLKFKGRKDIESDIKNHGRTRSLDQWRSGVPDIKKNDISSMGRWTDKIHRLMTMTNARKQRKLGWLARSRPDTSPKVTSRCYLTKPRRMGCGWDLTGGDVPLPKVILLRLAKIFLKLFLHASSTFEES